ncbi:MAG: 1-deoxy-D-xylulose-5-phosphate synthase [Candidatus Gastranaerophilales bacterium]|nr:1-deoxy-D-xylulose-5-phosphate synthase [Candidatus Gastranaerophilales bacterium]
MILDKIDSPQDLKELSVAEMDELSAEMRNCILKRVNTIGGHLGPDLGIVEASIAMHYVFNSPVDKFVFDVSHQCYPHKMLTGRKEGFTTADKYFSVSGYSNPEESEHDHFIIGHTSTSVSLATGLAKARDLKGEKYNVIALIGDGSLSGGEAYEGLNNAAVLGSNIIIVVNDNEMSIAENHGGLYENLKLLRKTNGKSELNFFKALGFDYHYVENGNDIKLMISAFENIKDSEKPTVLHIHTLKGKGYEPAVIDKEFYHWQMPGFMEPKNETITQVESYDSITTDYILNKQKNDKTVVAISPATPGATGFSKEFRSLLGDNYTDVGIAEEHAIAYSSAIAKNGGKPVLAILSSFVQRTYDQLSQDLCLNNSPATILVYWGGLSNADMTHLGSFDIPLISNIPNIVYLAPTTKEEYLAMLDWSVEQKEHPVAIRVPFGAFVSTGKKDETNYSLLNKYETVEQGDKVAIIAVGNFFNLGVAVKTELQKKLGINATLINPKFLTGTDEELLNSLKNNHQVVVTLESGILDGGFGQKIASFYGPTDMKVLNFGGKKEFTDRVPMEVLFEKYHLTPELIVDDVKKVL